MKYTNEMIAEALTKNNGYVYMAARALKCNPKTIYRAISRSKYLQELLEDLRGFELDLTEQKLRQAILNGEQWAISLKLRTQGKVRGYVERTDITSGDKPITDSIVIYLPDNGRDKDNTAE